MWWVRRYNNHKYMEK